MEIGKFYEKGAGYEGTIKTRKLTDLGNVVFEPLENGGDAAPDFLVTSDGYKIGRAWKHQTKDKKSEYLNVVLDDPHMPELIRCRLVNAGNHHLLLWSRQ